MLSEVPRDTFHSLTHIHTVTVAANSLTSLDSSLFEHLYKLEELDVSENKIEVRITVRTTFLDTNKFFIRFLSKTLIL